MPWPKDAANISNNGYMLFTLNVLFVMDSTLFVMGIHISVELLNSNTIYYSDDDACHLWIETNSCKVTETVKRY